MKEPQVPAIPDLPLSTTTTTTTTNMSTNPPRFLIIGAGSRGNAYGRAVTTATGGTIHAVAEPHAFKRQNFGRKYIWGEKGSPQPGQEFAEWRDWLAWEVKRRETSPDDGTGVDGVFVCTLDEMHVEILEAIAPLKLHVLCEKPLAVSLEDCLKVYRALLLPGGESESESEQQQNQHPSTIFSIGHVLRYSPYNILLRKLLLTDRVIGDIVSLEHTEPIGNWHFSHSYVRGNWRRQTPHGDGSLLTKSCHDLDFIMWLLSSPPPSQGQGPQLQPHHPRTITSSGTLTQFKRNRKPALAGNATNCLSCPAERECDYSAVRIYRDLHVNKAHYRWPVTIVCPDIEDVVRSASNEDAGRSAAETHLLTKLSEDYSRTEMDDSAIAARPWFGRCVWESDNDVCDDQVVTITWDDDETDPNAGVNVNRIAKSAIFHMIAPTEKQCERRGRVYGTQGEMSYDGSDITIYSFATRTSTTIEVPKQPPEEQEAHGGGDYGLARSFVRAVDAVKNQGWEVQRAQTEFIGCTLEEAVRSHAVVFAAEEARREEKVVFWNGWWEEKLASVGVRS